MMVDIKKMRKTLKSPINRMMMNRKRNQGSSIYIIAYNYIYKFNTEKFNIVKLFGICLDKVCSKQAVGEVYPN